MQTTKDSAAHRLSLIIHSTAEHDTTRHSTARQGAYIPPSTFDQEYTYAPTSSTSNIHPFRAWITHYAEAPIVLRSLAYNGSSAS